MEPVRPDELRVSDAERHVVQERLRRAVGDGPLDLHEFDVRVQSAWSARTRGELVRVTADPARTPAAQPGPAGRSGRCSRTTRRHGDAGPDHHRGLRGRGELRDLGDDLPGHRRVHPPVVALRRRPARPRSWACSTRSASGARSPDPTRERGDGHRGPSPDLRTGRSAWSSAGGGSVAVDLPGVPVVVGQALVAVPCDDLEVPGAPDTWTHFHCWYSGISLYGVFGCR